MGDRPSGRTRAGGCSKARSSTATRVARSRICAKAAGSCVSRQIAEEHHVGVGGEPDAADPDGRRALPDRRADHQPRVATRRDLHRCARLHPRLGDDRADRVRRHAAPRRRHRRPRAGRSRARWEARAAWKCRPPRHGRRASTRSPAKGSASCGRSRRCCWRPRSWRWPRRSRRACGSDAGGWPGCAWRGPGPRACGGSSLLEASLMLGAGCLTGAVAGIYGQVVIDGYLRQVTGFPLASVVGGAPAARDPRARARARPGDHGDPRLAGLARSRRGWRWTASMVSAGRPRPRSATAACRRARRARWRSPTPATGAASRRSCAASCAAGSGARARSKIPSCARWRSPSCTASASTRRRRRCSRRSPPGRTARTSTRAIVALELLFDYLDGLTERPRPDPLADGERLFAAYSTRSSGAEPGDGEAARATARSADDGYLRELSRTVARALARLPAAAAITEVAQRIAARGGQAQTRMHAAARLGTAQVEQWAGEQARGTGLAWRELLAGAASSVLDAARADRGRGRPRDDARAGRRDRVCLSRHGVPLTLLDELVDHDEDARAGREIRATRVGLDRPATRRTGSATSTSSRSRRALAGARPTRSELAATRTRALADGPHHAMTLVGDSGLLRLRPGRRGELRADRRGAAAPAQTADLPHARVMRGWRLAKRGTAPRAMRGRRLAKRGTTLRAMRGAAAERGDNRRTPARRASIVLGEATVGSTGGGAMRYAGWTCDGSALIALAATGAPSSAAADRVLNVHDEGHLHLLFSSGSELSTKGPRRGPCPAGCGCTSSTTATRR